MCRVQHNNNICDYRDAIVLVMITACKEIIPTCKPVNN